MSNSNTTEGMENMENLVLTETVSDAHIIVDPNNVPQTYVLDHDLDITMEGSVTVDGIIEG